MPASTRDRLAQKVAAKKAKVKADVKADETSGDGSWFWPVVILVLALWIGLFFLDTGGDIEEGSLYNTLGVRANRRRPTASNTNRSRSRFCQSAHPGRDSACVVVLHGGHLPNSILVMPPGSKVNTCTVSLYLAWPLQRPPDQRA